MGPYPVASYDKLLRIRGEFVTPTARRLGEARHAFLEQFLAAFFREWEPRA